ncbi:hypothetical protein PACTADRAFT_36077 [Pachysolen tannophilus NRRL Y-2460]|uniref:Uncharacterized protein n=1 Tax=Pachysolen tannophilus NRRL Y-2460 TaxID=669874 RepID=A0A1E4TNZ2_PACTA|nr:hypothetical protein PACTADRAFT_36077 [Pachysolen tannophilus NRRL Y-2460]
MSFFAKLIKKKLIFMISLVIINEFLYLNFVLSHPIALRENPAILQLEANRAEYFLSNKRLSNNATNIKQNKSDFNFEPKSTEIGKDQKVYVNQTSLSSFENENENKDLNYREKFSSYFEIPKLGDKIKGILGLNDEAEDDDDFHLYRDTRSGRERLEDCSQPEKAEDNTKYLIITLKDKENGEKKFGDRILEKKND